MSEGLSDVDPVEISIDTRRYLDRIAAGYEGDEEANRQLGMKFDELHAMGYDTVYLEILRLVTHEFSEILEHVPEHSHDAVLGILSEGLSGVVPLSFAAGYLEGKARGEIPYLTNGLDG